MTRDEHLQWCKDRALEYVTRGDLHNAVTSMMSDLRKHADFQGETYSFLMLAGMMDIAKGPEAVKRWINGFN